MNQFYQREADKINQNAINREIKELFDNAKCHKSLPTIQPKSYCQPQKLANYFEKHFNFETNNLAETP